MTYIDDIKAMYDKFNGRNILIGCGLFIVVYAFISYIGSSRTTSQLTNMGIPVGDYEGNSWASNIANIAISVPLSIIVIWILLHLIKVLFHFDLMEVIQRILGGHPVSEIVHVANKNIEHAEVKTATFLHSLKQKIEKEYTVEPYKQESFSLINNDLGKPMDTKVEKKETVTSYAPNSNLYSIVEGV
jgi:hypothetical protein